jgi:hypothetical protein
MQSKKSSASMISPMRTLIDPPPPILAADGTARLLKKSPPDAGANGSGLADGNQAGGGVDSGPGKGPGSPGDSGSGAQEQAPLSRTAEEQRPNFAEKDRDDRYAATAPHIKEAIDRISGPIEIGEVL